MNHFFDSSSCVHYHFALGKGARGDVGESNHKYLLLIASFVVQHRRRRRGVGGGKTLATSGSNFRQQQFLSWQNRERRVRQVENAENFMH